MSLFSAIKLRARRARSSGISLITRRVLPSILALAAFLAALTPSVRAADPAPFTTIRAIRALPSDQAGGHPVALEAIVTYYSPVDVNLFLQQGRDAIYVQALQNQRYLPGDRVLVRGKTRASFNTDVVADSVTVLGHGPVPAPVPATYQQLIGVQRDCMLVTVRGTVRSADTVNFVNMHGAYLNLMMPGGIVEAAIGDTDPVRLKQLLDADVEVTGVVSGKFDSKMQLIGIQLEVSSLAAVKLLKPPAVSPDALPITPMDKVLSVTSPSGRVRVKGSITYYRPGSAVVLQSGPRSIWISTRSGTPLRIGDVAIATGFPDARNNYLTLDDGDIQDTGAYEAVQPQPATWNQLAVWNSGELDGRQTDLVSFEGVVVTAVREQSQDEFVLRSDGKLFNAVYRHPHDHSRIPPLWYIPAGATIRVTGICMVVQADLIDPTQQEVPFNILLRSYDDIAILAQPSLINIRNLVVLISILVLLVLVLGVRQWIIDRRTRSEIARSAYVERRRSRILEDINGTRPLSEILEQITELVSSRLSATPCWCQIVDGAQLGNRPSELSSFRVIEETIPARAGPPLGTIYAAIDRLAQPRLAQKETLASAAALATLAIETRRLLTDLVYRSEYDQLTDVHNRFWLERCLDQRIEQARETAAIFGLVYVDLNDFKQVNDLHGHHIGDLYLREVSVRMKRQLRAGDTLARLGGDEFAALLAQVRNRADIEEIAGRLTRCFDEPFTAEGSVVHGSASIGVAVYPEDGATRESLLRTADATMYVNKHIRQEIKGRRPGPNPSAPKPSDP